MQRFEVAGNFSTEFFVGRTFSLAYAIFALAAGRLYNSAEARRTSSSIASVRVFPLAFSRSRGRSGPNRRANHQQHVHEPLFPAPRQVRGELSAAVPAALP